MTMLTMKQVAEMLQVSHTGAYARIHRTRDPLPAIRTSERGGYRVDESELHAWIKRQAVAA